MNELREKIVDIIRKSILGVTRGYACDMADQILALLSEEIEKVKNPYDKYGDRNTWDEVNMISGFESCRQKILACIKEEHGS